MKIVDDNQNGILRGYIGKTGVIIGKYSDNGDFIVRFDGPVSDSRATSVSEINTRIYEDRELRLTREYRVKQLLEKLR